MKILSRLEDLRPYGIVARSVASCELRYRHLCQLDARGMRLVTRALGLSPVVRNRGFWPSFWGWPTALATIQLPQELHTPLSVFALLDSGCVEVWITNEGEVHGVEPGDDQAQVMRAWHAVRLRVARTLKPPAAASQPALDPTGPTEVVTVVDEFATIWNGV